MCCCAVAQLGYFPGGYCRPQLRLQVLELLQGLHRPAGIAQAVDKFERAQGVKPLVKLAQELRRMKEVRHAQA